MIGYLFLAGLIFMFLIWVWVIYLISDHNTCKECGWYGKCRECDKEILNNGTVINMIFRCPLCGNIVDVHTEFK